MPPLDPPEDPPLLELVEDEDELELEDDDEDELEPPKLLLPPDEELVELPPSWPHPG
ncbi:hypothetical protein [Rhizorhapis suberifaciens]|uniref:Uncharacterized protein n=1 Tax=Rhizorhapis suberifaciens TaxID=13656 RepID=A0A840HSV0_9SPHN|nr:hypothetical protein [Rhizorhapis suberifaciens]MBB4640586.1 hypothetical protein [Rhizorhapis suberifaciens]